ncbi:hypothetical protein BT67DRAFT_184276 [Trichocladium antarcticum]|uniref:Uncharacterized protein n=1 Tax=Trichocladium antarcticum TaxID=1450529 RepID=A0AAN6ZEW2_9PEZI|nr:hypothetical protein BT67DRAFT_184276 [Trichocladium antarcticum]
MTGFGGWVVGCCGQLQFLAGGGPVQGTPPAGSLDWAPMKLESLKLCSIASHPRDWLLAQSRLLARRASVQGVRAFGVLETLWLVKPLGGLLPLASTCLTLLRGSGT